MKNLARRNLDALTAAFLLFWLSFNYLHAAVIEATVTADNHYGLYIGTDADLVFVGRNEKGSSGIGGYNWSRAERFSGITVTEQSRFYLAQWDDAVVPSGQLNAQAILAQFLSDDGRYLLTNRSAWGFYEAGANPGNYGDSPSADALEVMLQSANWTSPGFSIKNGQGVWGAQGLIPGISPSADWISRYTDNDSTAQLTVFRSVTVGEMISGSPTGGTGGDNEGGDGGVVPEPSTIIIALVSVFGWCAAQMLGRINGRLKLIGSE